MNMKSPVLVTAVALVSSALWAQEAEQAASADAATTASPAADRKVAFTALALCRSVEGEAEVCRPGGDWAAAEEGRFYPLGSSYRTGKDGRLVVSFGGDSSATIADRAEFGTRAQPLGEKSRTVVLVRGLLSLKLADNLPEGAFFVTAPGFTVKNPAGESRYDYVDMGDGDKVTVRCVTGSLAVEGRHFSIPVMRSANEVVIRTSRDHLSTFLFGTSGDYVVKLDKDVRQREEFGDDGKMKLTESREFAEFHLSPATKVVINRSVPAVGERMSAFIMAFDAAGKPVGEGIRLCEGRAELNSGELVAKEKVDSEELAKHAAEATETTEAAAVGESESADDGKKAEEQTSEGNED